MQYLTVTIERRTEGGSHSYQTNPLVSAHTLPDADVVLPGPHQRRAALGIRGKDFLSGGGGVLDHFALRFCCLRHCDNGVAFLGMFMRRCLSCLSLSVFVCLFLDGERGQHKWRGLGKLGLGKLVLGSRGPYTQIVTSKRDKNVSSSPRCPAQLAVHGGGRWKTLSRRESSVRGNTK